MATNPINTVDNEDESEIQKNKNYLSFKNLMTAVFQ